MTHESYRQIASTDIVEETELTSRSFQAVFYSVPSPDIDKTPYIAKAYTHENVWGMIPLHDEEERLEIITQELGVLRTLARDLNPHLGLLFLEDGRQEEAIVMKRIPTDDFLETKLASSESVPLEFFSKLAITVANYHFTPEVCPPAAVSSMTTFLSNLMQDESRILTERFEDKKETYTNWDVIMQKYLKENSKQLDQRQVILGDPIVGHGDIRIVNIIATGEGVVIDPAPIPLWKTNDRRMDAAFLTTDLELAGFSNEAEHFSKAYAAAYNDKVQQLGISREQQGEIENSNTLMDNIARMYRLTIFHRLARASNQQVRADKTFELLDKGYTAIDNSFALRRRLHE